MSSRVRISTSYFHLSVLISPNTLPPDSKFPDNPEATYAFQKVSVAYNILSNPSSKRVYDLHPASHEFSCNAAGATMCAEETLRSVVIGIFNDFLDGDLEMVRTLLRKFFSNRWFSSGRRTPLD
jgi:DnaJ-class molecular chaperone